MSTPNILPKLRFPVALAGLGLALVLMTARATRADAGAAADRGQSPYFFVEGGDPAVDRLPLERTEVRFAISGVIADVTLEQTYKNDGARPISARYVFPGSTRAAVHGMRMTVGEQVIKAQIQERKQAQATYGAAKDAGKTASLLEQERPNVFSMRVANVMPGDRIHVQLCYTEHLLPTDGTYEFVVPTVVGPRYPGSTESAPPEPWVASPYLHETEPPRYAFALAGRLATGVPVQSLATPSHNVEQRFLAPNRVDLTLSPGEQAGGDRDFILRYRLAGEQVESGLLLYEGEEENFFLLTVQPPARVEPSALPPREYVFVLDVSGSMRGFPLDTAKQVLRDLARELRPQDAFNVMLFSGASHVLWKSSRPATPENVALAMDAIDDEGGAGSTELLAALQTALAMPSEPGTSRSFIVVTDGYIAAERDVFAWVRSHLGEANVFSFGIGTSVNRYLVEGLAKAGLGEAFVVTSTAESQSTADRFHRYVASPVLTDIAVETSGFSVYDMQPETIPDLLAERPIVVQGKWRGAPTGRIRVSGRTGGARYAQRVDVAEAAPNPEHAALARLWARTRIADVADFSFGDETQEERTLVTGLGLRYGLLTEFTSFVAVARGVRNPSGASQAVDQPLPLPLGVADSAVGAPIYGAPEPELWLLIALLALGALALTRKVAERTGR